METIHLWLKKSFDREEYKQLYNRINEHLNFLKEMRKNNGTNVTLKYLSAYLDIENLDREIYTIE